MNGINAQQFPFGVCPFMSSMQIVAAAPAGNIVPVNAGGSTVIFTPAPCLGDQCQLWSGESKQCSISKIAESKAAKK